MTVKKILFFISIVALTYFITSCAATSKAPESKSNEALSFETPADKGSVYLYRTGRAVGAAGQLSVKVNSIDAGGTGPGTFFKWDFKPGTYTFLSSTGESSAIVQLDVKAGQVYFIRQDARMGLETGRAVDSKQGMNEVKGFEAQWYEN